MDSEKDAVAKLTDAVLQEVDIEMKKRRDAEYNAIVRQLPEGYANNPSHKFVRGQEHGGYCVLCGTIWSKHHHSLKDVELSFARIEGKEWKTLPFQQRQAYRRKALDFLASREDPA